MCTARPLSARTSHTAPKMAFSLPLQCSYVTCSLCCSSGIFINSHTSIKILLDLQPIYIYTYIASYLSVQIQIYLVHLYPLALTSMLLFSSNISSTSLLPTHEIFIKNKHIPFSLFFTRLSNPTSLVFSFLVPQAVAYVCLESLEAFTDAFTLHSK